MEARVVRNGLTATVQLAELSAKFFCISPIDSGLVVGCLLSSMYKAFGEAALCVYRRLALRGHNFHSLICLNMGSKPSPRFASHFRPGNRSRFCLQSWSASQFVPAASISNTRFARISISSFLRGLPNQLDQNSARICCPRSEASS